MWKWKSDWGWCLGGAYFLAKFQAGGAYSGGAYKRKIVKMKIYIEFVCENRNVSQNNILIISLHA